MKILTKNRGFTLVELLVVIAIISILSVIGITIFNGAQKTARDAKRKADIYSLAQAVGLYYYDHGSWPSGAVVCSNGSMGAGTPGDKDWPASFKTAMAPYMANLPVDPINSDFHGYNNSGVCNAGVCIYCFAPNMWCGDDSVDTTNCSAGIANFWTYQEKCSDNMIGDSVRFKYGCSHFMKSIDPTR